MIADKLEIIRDGLRAYDRTRRHPVFRIAAFVDEVQEDNLEWNAACAIRDRLEALRTVQETAIHTYAAYAATERRLAGLLEARGIAPTAVPPYPAIPVKEGIELDARWRVRAEQEADRILHAFWHANRGYDRGYHRHAMEKYRVLVESLDVLPTHYAPAVYDYILRAIEDRLI